MKKHNGARGGAKRLGAVCGGGGGGAAQRGKKRNRSVTHTNTQQEQLQTHDTTRTTPQRTPRRNIPPHLTTIEGGARRCVQVLVGEEVEGPLNEVTIFFFNSTSVGLI